MASVHDGHRERIRKQYIKEGISEHMPPHKLLEILLFYSVPRRDTNELAHRLIETFGSFSAVLDAPIEDLVKVQGITENSAFLLKAILPAARIYLKDRENGKSSVAGKDDAAEYLSHRFFGCTVETVYLLCLDNKGRILSCPKLSEGDIISVGVSPRTVIEQALKYHATAVMLAHNHPKGFALPSKADIRMTIDIGKALGAINVQFLDHIIVADGDYISMAQSKDYEYLFAQ